MSAETEGTSTVTASSGSRPSAMSVQGVVEIALRAAAAVSLFIDKAPGRGSAMGMQYDLVTF